jgi:hypothetical protein
MMELDSLQRVQQQEAPPPAMPGSVPYGKFKFVFFYPKKLNCSVATRVCFFVSFSSFFVIFFLENGNFLLLLLQGFFFFEKRKSQQMSIFIFI